MRGAAARGANPHEVCERYRAPPRWGIGIRRCNHCSVFMRWEGLYCPCCGRRTSARRSRPAGIIPCTKCGAPSRTPVCTDCRRLPHKEAPGRCAGCGGAFDATYGGMYCSESCSMRRHPGTCPECGAGFAGYRDQKYCSRGCANTAGGRKRRLGRAPRACPACGRGFRGRGAKYCSQECRRGRPRGGAGGARRAAGRARREVSAGVVLFRTEGRRRLFLLLHYPSGHWDFAKGRMEPGEEARQTALRETAEETGITDVSFVDGFEEVVEYEFESGGGLVQKSVVFFLGQTRTRDVTISHEHRDHAWMAYGDAAGRVTFGNARRVLERARARLSGTRRPSGGRRPRGRRS